jgi:hypothetical protein
MRSDASQPRRVRLTPLISSSAMPLLAQRVKLADRIDPGRDAGMATHAGVTQCDDDLTLSDRSNRDLIAWLKPGFAHRLNWKRHLILGGDTRYGRYRIRVTRVVVCPQREARR